jgi:glycosyltransferase involved in cell wall biosynthesis
MKILYIVTQADLGGAQKSTLLLAGHFGGEIAAGSEKSELFDLAQKQNLPIHKLKFLKRGINPVFDLLALVELFFLIRKNKPDIAHLNSSKAGFLGSIAGKLAGAKVIFTARGFVFNEPHTPLAKLLFIVLEKFASLFRDQIITVSKADETSALNHKLIDPKKITTIHNAVPPVNFTERIEARKRLGIPDDKFLIGTIANFYPTKGLDILIISAAKLPSEILNKIHFVIIGSGPKEQNLKLLTTTYNLQPLFSFTGQITNASTLLRAIDVFVLPSRKEGFPLVLLEAMQAGLPIIATDVGGNKEALGDSALLISPEKPQELQQAMVEIINNPERRLLLSQKAQERSKLFTSDKLFSETNQIYKILMQS